MQAQMTNSSFEFNDEADQFYSSLEVGVTVHDSKTGDICYANEYAEDVYGYPKEKLSTIDLVEVSTDSLSRSGFIKRIRAAAEGHSQQFEWRITRPSGEVLWIEMCLSELTVEGQSYVIGIVRNIDDYKMKLRHFHLLNRIIRHNFRNKLQIVSGGFSQIDRQYDGAKVFDQMRRAIAELVKLTSWVNKITSLNGAEENTDRINVRTMLEEEVDKYRSNYPEIDWEIRSENVYIDANPLLRKAFHELIDNAVRHNSHEGLAITVSASENMADQQIDIQVSDTGQPIPDIEITPLLNSEEPDQLKHGDKIGLWEVQTIVNRHRGMLKLKENSTEQKVIEITLPLADPK
ncbi:sensor histidine kinase [Halonotius roseus]|jgi:PAS domain S-box-containing protein|uniref:histidine kinase n=1 Tax=Halonotius roseus TaxID=2511997 RepID=A0A544QM49_9EURY|nr:PAS domain-containing sensor histidine kinase [Halonotius roseus]TQQ79679.1 PAS domain-containing sensor histidine kinase [Halonotius roseus]